MPAGRETLFARALQFSSRMTGVVLSIGNSFWQTSEANYFGHNAILVSRPSPSAPPAGVLRPAAARWRDPEPRFRRGGLPAPRRLVLLALPELRGSYEELPSNLLDYAVRDRRWMQGNLQHARLIAGPGLHWMSACTSVWASSPISPRRCGSPC